MNFLLYLLITGSSLRHHRSPLQKPPLFSEVIKQTIDLSVGDGGLPPHQLNIPRRPPAARPSFQSPEKHTNITFADVHFLCARSHVSHPCPPWRDRLALRAVFIISLMSFCFISCSEIWKKKKRHWGTNRFCTNMFVVFLWKR